MVETSRSADAPPPRIQYERHAGAASAPLTTGYRRREPEKTVLHAIVREHLETFLEEPLRHDGDGYPSFLEREFRRYLHCGLLTRGFARLRCPECGFERLLAFSCKGRLCPSCTARRMADIAADLVDHLLPEAPYRQWVLTVPWPLRFRLAVDRALLGRVLGIFLRTVFAWQRQRGRALGIRDGLTGSVTFVQRFGGALNLNPHFHSVLPDGLFVPREPIGTLAFVPLPEPSPGDIEALTFKIAHRITTAVEKMCSDDAQSDALLERTAAALQQALATALEPPLPKLALDLLGLDPQAMSTPLCAKIAGFSLHAARCVHAHDRDALERLCRYGLRAPFSQERLTLRDDGRVLYHLRRPWPSPDGANCLVLHPIEFLRRLAALVPAPYVNLVRYHGVFAGRSQWYARLPRPSSTQAREVSEAQPRDAQPPSAATTSTTVPTHSSPAAPARTRRRKASSWALLLRRVFFLDALTCPRCDTPMVVLALLSDPTVVRKILLHLELPLDLPNPAPAVRADDNLFDQLNLDTGPPSARPPP